MKNFFIILSLGLLFFTACSTNTTEDLQAYNDEPDAPISFSHVTGDFTAPIYESAGEEDYTSTQGITWTIDYNKVREEFLGTYSPTFRFVVIDTDDESFRDSLFLYSYDEALNPDAITQLKTILDSYNKN